MQRFLGWKLNSTFCSFFFSSQHFLGLKHIKLEQLLWQERKGLETVRSFRSPGSDSLGSCHCPIADLSPVTTRLQEFAAAPGTCRGSPWIKASHTGGKTQRRAETTGSTLERAAEPAVCCPAGCSVTVALLPTSL